MIVENRWALNPSEEERYEEILSDFLSERDFDATIDLSDLNFSPSRLENFLKDKGYSAGNYETNGWEMDFFVEFTKENCTTIMMEGCLMTYELTIRFNTDDLYEDEGEEN